MGMTTLGTRWQISKFWDTWDTLFWESVRNWRNASVARTQTKGRGVTSPCVNPSEQCRIANIQPGHRHSCQAENDIYIYTLDKHPKDELSSYFFGACITFHTYGSIASIGWSPRMCRRICPELVVLWPFSCARSRKTRADRGTWSSSSLRIDLVLKEARSTAVSIRSSYIPSLSRERRRETSKNWHVRVEYFFCTVVFVACSNGLPNSIPWFRKSRFTIQTCIFQWRWISYFLDMLNICKL